MVLELMVKDKVSSTTPATYNHNCTSGSSQCNSWEKEIKVIQTGKEVIKQHDCLCRKSDIRLYQKIIRTCELNKVARHIVHIKKSTFICMLLQKSDTKN